MILVSGIPKSGTHALLKAVELLGVPAPMHEHLPFGPLPAGTEKHLYIIRHPRNILMSWVRFENKPVTTGTLIGAMRDFAGKRFAEVLESYMGWLTDPQTFIVRYERLCSTPDAIRDIAIYLDVPYLDDAFPNLPGLTPTWTGSPSDWRTVWNPEVDCWWDARCQAAQLAMGYDDGIAHPS